MYYENQLSSIRSCPKCAGHYDYINNSLRKCRVCSSLFTVKETNDPKLINVQLVKVNNHKL